MRSRRSLLRLLAAGATLPLVGCNLGPGDEPGDGTATDREPTGGPTASERATATGSATPTATVTPTATPAPTATPTETPTRTPTPTATPGRGEQVAAFTGSDSREYDHFGAALAVAEDALFVAAPGDAHSETGGPEGSVYVFERAGGEWRQRSKLRPDPESFPFDYRFGTDVAVSDGTLVVGALERVGPHSIPRGGAVVFAAGDDGWEQTATLRADRASPEIEEAFGRAVAVDGGTVLVGAPWGADGDERPGAVYVFDRLEGGSADGPTATGRPAGEWRRTARLSPDAGDSDYFGRAVALDGDAALVGAPEYETADGDTVGRAYLFERGSGGWRRRTALAPAVNQNPGDGDHLGSSVALEGSTALVAAWGAGEPNGFYGGAVYAFERVDGDWIPETKLAAADGDPRDVFGSDVALSGDRALVGAEHDDSNGENAGSAYLFGRDDDGEWRQDARLLHDDHDPHDLFGTSVGLSADRGFVGAIDGETEASGPNAGAVYVFSA
ncbi:hypothetical protein [Halosimplex marinum]|uniref:hypothetical protein n=1 Tax=Halosimplex marinum TaxID=3396620 RepID=UPI003F55A0EC